MSIAGIFQLTSGPASLRLLLYHLRRYIPHLLYLVIYINLHETAGAGFWLSAVEGLPETATAGTVVVVGTNTVSTGVAAGVSFLSSSLRVGVSGAGVSFGVGSGVGKVFRGFLVSKPPRSFGFWVTAGVSATNTVGAGTGVGDATRAPASIRSVSQSYWKSQYCCFRHR